MLRFIFVALFIPSYALASFLPDQFSAEFEQEKVGLLKGKLKKSKGILDYKFPRQIRMEITSPDPSTFVANAKRSWYYTPPFIAGEQGTVIMQKSDDLVLTKFLDTLKGGLKANKVYTPKFDGKQVSITFTPAVEKDLQLKEVILHSAQDAQKAQSLGDFTEMDLVYLDQQKVKLRFLKFDTTKKFDIGHFIFDVPSKTKVTQGK